MLAELHLKDVGPGSGFEVEFGRRLNLLSGDNGLGKTFLLDVAWWALTGTWAGNRAWPYGDSTARPNIAYQFFLEQTYAFSESYLSEFQFVRQDWSGYPAKANCLVIYARADGFFSVWDPVRNHWALSVSPGDKASHFQRLKAYLFDQNSLWNELKQEDNVYCNGLIRDWVNWQHQPDQGDDAPFQILKRVLEHLSPASPEVLHPGKPVRVSISDVRDIPTIDFPYGNVPITLASASVKRALGLAYLLVWTWYEHLQASRLIGQAPVKRLVLLIDEIESHLHPLWQRSFLPSILDIATRLDAQIQTQVIATTHSPLVLASAEPYFDEQTDRLFLFEIKDKDVLLSQVPWVKQGDAVGWLTSEV